MKILVECRGHRQHEDIEMPSRKPTDLGKTTESKSCLVRIFTPLINFCRHLRDLLSTLCIEDQR